MDNFFFWCSKIIWAIIAPDNLLLILLTVAIGFFWLGRDSIAKTLLTILITGMWLLATLPIGHWLLYPLEARFPTNPILPKKIDGIIMLGGAEKVEASKAWDQVELKEYSERALMFMVMARKYPDAKLLVTAGSGSVVTQELKEADVAKRLFREQGLDVTQMFFEQQSRNTYDNAVFSKRLVEPKKSEIWLLITSASHIPRAVGVFRKIGWSILPCPVDHQTNGNQAVLSFAFAENLQQFTFAVREWIGLLAYFLTNKTSELLPKAGVEKP